MGCRWASAARPKQHIWMRISWLEQSLPCLLKGIPVTGESTEQEQDDFKTTIIYSASCHCKLWLKVLFLLRHSSFLVQALPLNSADILKRTGTEGVQWGLGSISRQTRLKWLQAMFFSPWGEGDDCGDQGDWYGCWFWEEAVFAFDRRESSCTD